METHDDYYALKESIQNLMILKMAFDQGLNVADYPEFMVDQYGGSNGWEIFCQALKSLVTIMEWWPPYDGREEEEEKSYWVNQYCLNDNIRDDVQSMGVMVLLDDRIDQRTVKTGSVGGGNEWYEGFADISSCENGIIIYWFEDDGPVDLANLFGFLVLSLPEMEDKTNEMAV